MGALGSWAVFKQPGQIEFAFGGTCCSGFVGLLELNFCLDGGKILKQQTERGAGRSLDNKVSSGGQKWGLNTLVSPKSMEIKVFDVLEMKNIIYECEISQKST